ncbi:unnamed protein product [Tilletia controversa]|nr:unnamed protein product [Tilletia controversa]
MDSVSIAAAADRVVRAVTTVALHDDELASWADAYAADPRWRRIWRRALTRYESGALDTVANPPQPQESRPQAKPPASESLTEDGDKNSVGGEDAEESVVSEESVVGEEPEAEAKVPVAGSEPEDKAKTPSPAQQSSTRTLRPRTIMAVHRSNDDELYFVREGLLFVKIKEGVRL